jgi:thioredoxin-like negative regulator of GroEL
MAEIEYGANTEFCQELGITKLPTVNIYSNGRKVDGFPCGPKKYSLLLEKLDTYLRLSHEELAFEAEMNQGAALADTVLSTLNSQQKSASNSNSNKDDKPVMM